MSEFLKAFEAIDTDFSGDITREELEAYCQKQNFEDVFAQKWIDLFDADKNGTISIDEYCDALGLRPNVEYIEKVEIQKTKSVSAEEDSMEGVRVITADKSMSEDLMRQIVRLAREAQDKSSAENDIARYIKCELDGLDQSAWHVIVGRFSYGSYCSHEIGCMLHFFVDRFAILVWRTPNY